MTINVTGSVRIDVPALAAFVAYLEGAQQKQIDDFVAREKAGTVAQHKSTEELQSSLDAQSK